MPTGSSQLRRVLVALITLTTASTVNRATAADIKVLCSNGMRAAMEDLVPQFERTTTHHVVIVYGLGAALKRQIEGGEAFDLAILTPALIDDLARQGKVDRDSRITLARSRIALAVRAGAPKPEIGTTDALTRVLHDATSIAYAGEGAGGVFFADLARKLNLTDALKAKSTLTTTGAEAGAAVARGEVQYAALPVSEILPMAGIEALGELPPDLRGYAVMVAGVGARTTQKAAIAQLLAFVRAPAARPVLEKKGMQPG